MARAATQQRDMRSAISAALYRCISEKGFANTTLKDIAEQANMTPSHIGYYFDNKASILEYYGAAVCRRNVTELPDLNEPDLGRLIDSIATFCLGAGQMSEGLLGVIQELNGLAVHDPKLHEIKVEHATAWRKYLESFFDHVRPIAGLTSRDAAHLAHAMLIGLNTNTLFDPELDRETARQLFRNALRALASAGANLDQPVRIGSLRKPKKSRRKEST